MNPEPPPMAKNRKAGVMTGRPSQIVAIQANTATALGTEMMIDALLKNDIARLGSPVANMWCTHTAEPRIIVATVDSATGVYPTKGRRQNTGNPSETMPIA